MTRKPCEGWESLPAQRQDCPAPWEAQTSIDITWRMNTEHHWSQLPIHLFQHVHTPLSKNNAGLLLHLQLASTNPDAWLVDACIGRPTLQLGCQEGHQQQGHHIFTRFVETQQSLYRQQQVRVWSPCENQQVRVWSHWSHMATGMKDLVSGLKAKKWQLSDFGLWKVRSKVRHLEFVESMCLFRDTSKGLKFWQDILFT